jgi:hypothetical protein
MDPASIEQQALRICASRTFNDRLQEKQLLRGLVTKNLQAGELIPYSIGVDCLELPGTFDPASDSTLRGVYKKLREHLVDYYLTEGLQDPIIIRAAKGYKLSFFANPNGANALEIRPNQQVITVSSAAVELLITDDHVYLHIAKNNIWAGCDDSGSIPADAPVLHIDEDLLDEVVVVLIQGKNLLGHDIYAYVQLTLRDMREVSLRMRYRKQFDPRNFGTVLVTGLGEPTEYLRSHMTAAYHMVDWTPPSAANQTPSPRSVGTDSTPVAKDKPE